MRTTVIVSRHGAALYLLPMASPALDLPALQDVLRRHGQELVDSAELPRAIELIAAEGFDPVAASALAEELRAAGLHARVVNATALASSDRVEGAFGAQMMIALAGFLVVLAGIWGGAPVAVGWAVGAVGGALLALAAFNALVLGRGGSSLQIAGVPRAAGLRPLTAELSLLAEQLPQHLAEPLLARARQLEAHALREPGGEAARELDALVAELRGHTDRGGAEEVQALRVEVDRARRAAQETRGGS